MTRKITITDAIVEYRNHLKSKGDADNTIATKIQPLTRAVKVWGDVQVSTIRPVHMDRLFAEAQWAERTRNLYMGTLRQFFAWSRQNGYMDRDYDPLFGWRNVKVPKQTKMRLPVEEFYPLLDSMEHPRDRFAIAVGLFLFLRGSEIQHLRVNDINLSDLTITVYRPKTKDTDVMPVSSELREEAVRWLNWYRADQNGLDGNWYLVPSKKPDEWTHGVLPDGTPGLVRTGKLSSLRPEQRMSHPYRVAQRALSALGYDTKGEGEHTLRRSGSRAYADRLRSEGVDHALMATASMLGHSDVRITQHYIGWEIEKENRNKAISGKPLFPGIAREGGTLRVVKEGTHG